MAADRLPQNGESDTTLWRWESGIPLPPMPATTAAPPLPADDVVVIVTSVIALAD